MLKNLLRRESRENRDANEQQDIMKMLRCEREQENLRLQREEQLRIERESAHDVQEKLLAELKQREQRKQREQE